MPGGRPKGSKEISPIVRRAFIGALAEMKEKGETKGRHVLTRIIKKLLMTEDNPRVVLDTIKLVMERETKVTAKVEVQNGEFSETRLVETLLAKTQQLSDEEFERMAVGLRTLGSESGTAGNSVKH